MSPQERSPRQQWISMVGLVAALCVLSGGLCAFLTGCRFHHDNAAPQVVFDKVPPGDKGGPFTHGEIAGHVSGGRPEQRIVLYARSGPWWIQPDVLKPMTEMDAQGRWRNTIHLGTEYAALLVDPGYHPQIKASVLPEVGGEVAAVVKVKPPPGPEERLPMIRFSGYEWTQRTIASPRNGRMNLYEPSNSWVDSEGALHLKIARRDGQWTSAEVAMKRSLGYGTYVFRLRDVAHIGPWAALSLFTWDDGASEVNFREMDMEFSQWGKAAGKNAQYVVQPYYVAENVSRFMAPAGAVTASIRWERGHASFATTRGFGKSAKTAVIAEHTFSSGVPTPGGETVHLTFCIPGGIGANQPRESEVVIDKFEYYP